MVGFANISFQKAAWLPLLALAEIYVGSIFEDVPLTLQFFTAYFVARSQARRDGSTRVMASDIEVFTNKSRGAVDWWNRRRSRRLCGIILPQVRPSRSGGPSTTYACMVPYFQPPSTN